MNRQHFEFEGLVTQLGATSEVASIGVDLTCPIGEEIEIEEWITEMSAQGAGESTTVQKLNSNAKILRRIGAASLDSQFMQNQISSLEAAANVVNARGSNIRERLRAEQVFRMVTDSTLDATTEFLFRIVYSSIFGPATLAVVGSGITLTTTKHELV